MSNEPWRELDEEDVRLGAKELIKEMKRANVNPELAEEVLNQVMEITNEKHNIIFVFTDNEWAVTGIHVPDEAVGDEESPVLMRGANPKHIIAAFPQSEVRSRISSADELEIITGLQQDADERWLRELEVMCEQVRVKLRNNPPEMWEDLLSGEND